MPATQTRETIGGYVIETELGRGAHGVVYRAHHADRPDIPVALKVIENSGDLDRLLLEPAVLSRLHHPGIVGIEDYFLAGSELVIALEFIDGKDLKTLLDEGATFGPTEVRELLIQMGSALAEAHAKNIMHRDIKPANILVTRTEVGTRYVLTDFGIGQVAEGIQSKKHAGGTYLFMAPEQLRGRPTPQSDLWALGVVAYRLLTGRFPFPGPTLPELSQQILYQSPVPPGQLCPQPIEPQLERTVTQLLDKSLQERVASAEELLTLLGHKPGASGTVRPRQRDSQAPRGQESLDQQIRRGLAWRWTLIVVCVLCYLLPAGIPSSLCMLFGMVLFYLAQVEEDSTAGPIVGSVLAYLLLGTSLGIRRFLPQWDVSLGHLTRFLSSELGTSWGGVFGNKAFDLLSVMLAVAVAILILAVVITWYLLPVIASSLYVGVRRLQREKLLRDSAVTEEADSDTVLEALRRCLDSRFEDVGFHLKYAEALFARGRVKDAAVEALLLLRQDPYHFSGNLLLANAYFQLDLLEDCIKVCSKYLRVSGYCFEFTELREQCQRRLQP